MCDYPNLGNETLPSTLPCAGYTEEHVNHATATFVKVEPVPSTQVPYCRWFVEFSTLNGKFLPPPGFDLKTRFKQVMKHKPLNAKIMSRHIVSSKSIVIIYKVVDTCLCQEPLNFGGATKTPELWLVKNEQSFSEKVLFEMNSTA